MAERRRRKGGQALFPRKILVAVDGSEHSLRAARAAVAMAASARAPLLVAMVVQTPLAVYPAGSFAPTADYSGEVWKLLMEKAGKVLARVAGDAQRAGVAVRTRVLEGHVPTEIIRFARRERCDLVVVGSRGLSKISRLFLGSVSTALVQQAQVSVLVVR